MKSCTSYSFIPHDRLCTCLVCITRAEYKSGTGSGSSGIGDITGRKLCLEPSHLQKNLASNSWKRVEIRAKKTNSEDPYTVAVMRNSTAIGHVLCKMSAACALFFRRKLPHACMRFLELCTWMLRNTCTSCIIIKFGGCFAIHQTAKLKSSPNFPAIWYMHITFLQLKNTLPLLYLCTYLCRYLLKK